MKWWTKAILILAIAVLVGSVCAMVWVLRAKASINEYILRSTAAFNAAMLTNAEETYTEPDKAVIARYEGQRAVVAPENYKAVLYYLKGNAAPPLFRHADPDHALILTVCDETVFTVSFAPDGESGVLEMRSGGKSITMRISNFGLKDRLLACALTGTSAADSIQLP